MNKSILDGFRLAVAEKNLGVYGIHLYQENKGAVEHRFRSNERTHLFSGSKAFTSMAVGIAAKEGYFSLEDKILSFFPEYKQLAVSGAEEITVKDLLQMRGGHEEALFSTDEMSHSTTMDWAEKFFRMKQYYPAGTRYIYDNGCSYMLSRLIESVSGETLRNYLIPRIFRPLKIENPQWHSCPLGHTLGAFGLYLNTEEFSRLGILLLNEGIWEGNRLVPREYIWKAVNDTVLTEYFMDDENQQGYGYQLWRCTVKDAYRADGKYGQYSIVLPKQRAVVTITAHNENAANDILRAVWFELLPRLE